jgi:hypothetical protein
LHNVPTFVIRSTDGGSDWALVQVADASTPLHLSALQCPTASHCLAVGSGDHLPAIEQSDDGGATWTYGAASLGPTGDAAFSGLACTSSLDCETSVAPESGDHAEVDAWGTADGGQHWSKLGTMDTIYKAGYWGTDATFSSCLQAHCSGFSVNVEGPERPTYSVDVLASADEGASWTVYSAAFQPQGVAVATAADGTVVSVGTNAEGGPLILTGTP